MSAIMQKDEAHKLVDRMSTGATWDDLMQQIYVREVIGRGLADSQTGRGHCVNEVRAKYGLEE
jgi:hypothetical protein